MRCNDILPHYPLLPKTALCLLILLLLLLGIPKCPSLISAPSDACELAREAERTDDITMEYVLLCNLTDVTRFMRGTDRLGYSRGQAGIKRLEAEMQRAYKLLTAQVLTTGALRRAVPIVLSVQKRRLSDSEGIDICSCCSCCNSDIGLPEWQSL